MPFLLSLPAEWGVFPKFILWWNKKNFLMDSFLILLKLFAIVFSDVGV